MSCLWWQEDHPNCLDSSSGNLFITAKNEGALDL